MGYLEVTGQGGWKHVLTPAGRAAIAAEPEPVQSEQDDSDLLPVKPTEAEWFARLQDVIVFAQGRGTNQIRNFVSGVMSATQAEKDELVRLGYAFYSDLDGGCWLTQKGEDFRKDAPEPTSEHINTIIGRSEQRIIEAFRVPSDVIDAAMQREGREEESEKRETAAMELVSLKIQLAAANVEIIRMCAVLQHVQIHIEDYKVYGIQSELDSAHSRIVEALRKHGNPLRLTD